MACILLLSSVVKVHDSQAYVKMDVTRECINRILELREIPLSFQTGFNHVIAAVCAILVCAIIYNGFAPQTFTSDTLNKNYVCGLAYAVQIVEK